MQVQREPDHLHIRYREQRLPVALADVWHRLQVQQPVMTESIMVQDTEQQFMRLILELLLPHSTIVHVEITGWHVSISCYCQQCNQSKLHRNQSR